MKIALELLNLLESRLSKEDMDILTSVEKEGLLIRSFMDKEEIKAAEKLVKVGLLRKGVSDDKQKSVGFTLTGRGEASLKESGSLNDLGQIPKKPIKKIVKAKEVSELYSDPRLVQDMEDLKKALKSSFFTLEGIFDHFKGNHKDNKEFQNFLKFVMRSSRLLKEAGKKIIKAKSIQSVKERDFNEFKDFLLNAISEYNKADKALKKSKVMLIPSDHQKLSKLESNFIVYADQLLKLSTKLKKAVDFSEF